MTAPAEPVHHDRLAQEAGEQAYAALMEEAEEGGCACETCVVREVLTAAYDHLLAAAAEVAAEQSPREPLPWVHCTVPGCVTDVLDQDPATAKCARHQ